MFGSGCRRPRGAACAARPSRCAAVRRAPAARSTSGNPRTPAAAETHQRLPLQNLRAVLSGVFANVVRSG